MPHADINITLAIFRLGDGTSPQQLLWFAVHSSAGHIIPRRRPTASIPNICVPILTACLQRHFFAFDVLTVLLLFETPRDERLHFRYMAKESDFHGVNLSHLSAAEIVRTLTIKSCIGHDGIDDTQLPSAF